VNIRNDPSLHNREHELNHATGEIGNPHAAYLFDTVDINSEFVSAEDVQEVELQQ
jgi:hypothetical protein